MKICYLADAGSIHTQRHVSYFAENGKNEIHLISFNNNKFHKNLQLHYIEPCIKTPFFLNYIISIPKIKKLIHEIQPDLLHSMHLTSYGFIGACSNFKPFIISCLGSDILISPRKSFLHKWLTKYSINKANILTSVSNQITDNLYKLGAGSQKVATFPFGVDLNVFSSPPPGSNPDKGSLLSLRSLKPVYNIEMLLNAIGCLKKANTSFKLTIAGDGPDRAKLTKMADKLKISDVVDFIGAIPHTKIPEYLRNSSIYLSTSFSDGASICLMEAMASGCFPIVTDIPANRDWIKDGWNGFLVPVGDYELFARRIEQAINNSDLHKAAAQRNRGIITERGSWDKDMEKLALIYQSLTNPKN
jgi:L-malate glycosyltransferase